MAQVGEFPIEGTVSVTPHAIAQARSRAGFGDELSDTEVGERIALEVRQGIAQSLVFDVRPRGFRMGAAGKMPPWQRFVGHRVAGALAYGWVVALDRPPDVWVVTTLSPLRVPA